MLGCRRTAAIVLQLAVAGGERGAAGDDDRAPIFCTIVREARVFQLDNTIANRAERAARIPRNVSDEGAVYSSQSAPHHVHRPAVATRPISHKLATNRLL